MDLTGKLVIKATLGVDIRRIPIHNEDITYDELILMMQRVFRDQLSPSDDVTLKYKDEDGDLITLFDSADLAAAVEYSKVLKLAVFVNGKVVPNSDGNSLSNVAEVKSELRHLRDRINHLLDALDASSPGEAAEVQKISRSALGSNDAVDSDAGFANDVHAASSGANSAQSKEFDPLQSQVPKHAAKVPDDQGSVSSFTSAPPSTAEDRRPVTSENAQSIAAPPPATHYQGGFQAPPDVATLSAQVPASQPNQGYQQNFHPQQVRNGQQQQQQVGQQELNHHPSSTAAYLPSAAPPPRAGHQLYGAYQQQGYPQPCPQMQGHGVPPVAAQDQGPVTNPQTMPGYPSQQHQQRMPLAGAPPMMPPGGAVPANPYGMARPRGPPAAAFAKYPQAPVPR